MTRHLWGTTALAMAGAIAAAPAMAAEKIDIGIGGDYIVVLTFTDEDADTNDFNIVQDGSIEFEGESTLDNGLTAGVKVELRAFTDDDEGQIGDHYVWLEGPWGLFQAGSMSGAPEEMSYGAPSVLDGHGVTSPDFQHITGVANGNTGHLLNVEDTANKVNYFTPRISGFQFGVSYTPDADPNGLSGGYSSAYGFPLDDHSNEEIVGGAVNYVNDFSNDFSVAAYGGVEYVYDDIDGGDRTDWSVGGNVAHGGFTLGGGYTDREGDAYSIVGGLSYEQGVWGVSAAYGYFEDDDEEEFHRLEAGATYALGPGVNIGAGYFYYDDEAGDNDAHTGAMWLALSF